MPFGGLLSLAGPVLGIGGALGGLFGGTPASKVQTPPQYQYQNTSGADWNSYNGINNLGTYNVAANLLPQYQQIAQDTVNNRYAPGYQSGAGAAGDLGITSGYNAFDTGGKLTGNALGMLPDVSALISLGFDPQNALYSKLQQQNTEQTNASLASRGLASTPYGAGVASDSNRNFNTDWQSQLLSRATQGAGAAGNLLGNITGTTGAGAGLQAGAPGQVMQGAAAPYNTFQNINANALGVLGQTGQFGASAGAQANTQIDDFLRYLAQGTTQQNANTNTSNTQLGQANSVFGQNQILGGQLGGALAGLSKATTGWGQQGKFNWG